VSASAQFLNPSDAARRLGVSPKALRIYEEHGLLSPVRTSTGWRAYGPEQMRRAAEVAALRGLGFSLAQVRRVLDGDSRDLEPALARHQASLEHELGQISRAVTEVRKLRDALLAGAAPTLDELSRLSGAPVEPVIAFDLPWPWGGERFELRDVRALNFIIGPLASGKTRLALRLAEAWPGAQFVGLDRSADGGAAAQAKMAADPVLAAQVEDALAWLAEEGAAGSPALLALLVAIEVQGPSMLVIDMIEEGLDEASQAAVIAYLRRRGSAGRPLFIMTRSSAILDLEAMTEAETLLFCPPNHSPPRAVERRPGAPGYEAVATCLATPAVRARTAGVTTVMPVDTPEAPDQLRRPSPIARLGS
jgi:DNA-binding transcriptional MerR regulator